MFQINCLNPISKIGLENLTTDYKIIDNVNEAEGILVRSASMHEMELPENLLAVARAGAGTNNIPSDKCAEKGIVVFNTPGANANAVKELVIAGMLLASRDIVGGIEWVKANTDDANIAKTAEKEKKNFAGTELMGKKLGIIGLGAIGVKVANVARHFGMEVYGYDPYVSVNAAWSLSRDVKHVFNLDEIYENCDFITVHVPLMDSTKHYVNKEAINKMKDGVVLLNFARDLLVDEAEVLKGIAAKKSRKYVSDFPNPTTAGQEGCIVIPHLGAST
ncbi:MAG: 3-phosphoglycerate dehydrogenase, partial [Lachnospiraceae bacterium]|nr:3-phosphoglycerate dehydrogenase [Lachnospiraceae bacterium]